MQACTLAKNLLAGLFILHSAGLFQKVLEGWDSTQSPSLHLPSQGSTADPMQETATERGRGFRASISRLLLDIVGFWSRPKRLVQICTLCGAALH